MRSEEEDLGNDTKRNRSKEEGCKIRKRNFLNYYLNIWIREEKRSKKKSKPLRLGK